MSAPALRCTESQRHAVVARLRDPVWSHASDLEIASDTGTTGDVVRALRAEQRRNLDLAAIAPKLEELARRIAWPGTHAELLARVVDAACVRAEQQGYRHPDARMEAMRAALREDREQRALEALAPPKETTRAA